MRKTLSTVALFALAAAAGSVFAEGTVDPNHPDSRFQLPQVTSYAPPADDIRNANSADWGVGG